MTHSKAFTAKPASALALLIDAIDNALPQTQCTRCGYPDCRHYAEAIASNAAAINQCPPGGQEGIERLSTITGQPLLPLNPDNGVQAPRAIARIDENWCIGCTLCIEVCPTDAILGANKRMHTILRTACTGCELCLPVCPVDCIAMDNVSGNATGWAAWSQEQAIQARNRYKKHSDRRLMNNRKTVKNIKISDANPIATEPDGVFKTPPPATLAHTPAESSVLTDAANKKATIAAILAKAKQQHR